MGKAEKQTTYIEESHHMQTENVAYLENSGSATTIGAKLNESTVSLDFLGADQEKDIATLQNYHKSLNFLTQNEKDFLLSFCEASFKILSSLGRLGSTNTPFNTNNIGDGLLDLDTNGTFIDLNIFEKKDFKQYPSLYIKLNTFAHRNSLCKYMNALFRRLYEGKEKNKSVEGIRKHIESQYGIKVIFTPIDFSGYKANKDNDKEKQKQLTTIHSFLSSLPNDMRELCVNKTIYIGGVNSNKLGHVYTSDTISFHERSIFITSQIDSKVFEHILAHELFHKFDQTDDKYKDNKVFEQLNNKNYKRNNGDIIINYLESEFALFVSEVDKQVNNEKDDSLTKLEKIKNKGTRIGTRIKERLFNEGVLYKNKHIQLSDIIGNDGLFTDSFIDIIEAKEVRVIGHVSLYASESPDEDQAETGSALLNGQPKELLNRCKTDDILRKKVMAISGCYFDTRKGKFTKKLSDQEYKQLFGTTSEYFKKRSQQAGPDFWNKKFGK